MSKIIENYSDIHRHVVSHPSLPIIHWEKVSAEKPQKVTITDPSTLPKADIAIITWTSAEWSAFDHVFLNSGSERDPYETSWREDWLPYPNADHPVIYFQMVKVKKKGHDDIKVLLVKSEVHLAHYPWISGLEKMVDQLLEKSEARMVLSTGTAGAAQDTQKLGDVVLTNAAKIKLKKPDNLPCDYNDKTFYCEKKFHDTELLRHVKEHLMMPLSDAWTDSVIDSLLAKLDSDIPAGSHKYTYDDLVNGALKPDCLKENQVQIMNEKPLLTTDFYFTTDTDHPLEEYSFLEMDDAVIAHQAKKAGVDYGFIRNVSDPVVVDTDASGNPIPKNIQGNWSGMVYSYSGFYTSFNSALTAWATISDLV